MATIKATLQNVAQTIGVKSPDSFVGNDEATARRLLRAASAAGRNLRNHQWRALTFEHTFTTVSGTQTYAVPTNPAFHSLVQSTAFDRTNYRQLRGQETAQDWQSGEALLVPSTGIQQRFRIRRSTDSTRVNKIYLLDDPGGAYTLAFEYITHEWIYDGSNTYYEDIQADSDQPVYDDYLFEVETLWRALKALGEPYSDELAEANELHGILLGQEQNRPLTLSGRRPEAFLVNTPETGFGL